MEHVPDSDNFPLTAHRTYTAVSVRLLRLATNGFMEHINLIIRTIHEFAPASSKAEKDVEGVRRQVEQSGIAV